MRDLQTAAILGWSPLCLTNQDGQLKTLQRRTATSLIILCLSLTNRPSQLKGADCRRRLPETNTNKHTLQTAPVPPSVSLSISRSLTDTHAHTHVNTTLPETNTSAHTCISPLLRLSLPDETNRMLIHKMEGKNALVYNHWLLHRLGGWIKGQSNIISWYRPVQHTNYSFKGKQGCLNLTVYQCI